MQVLVGSYRLSDISYTIGTRKIRVNNWKDKFSYDNIISISIHRGGAGNSSFIVAQPGKWSCNIYQINLTTYEIEYSHSHPILEENDGVQIVADVNRPQDIYVSNISSPAITVFPLNILGQPILSTDTIVNSNKVMFEDGHGCEIDNHINFYGDQRFNQSRVIGITGNTIELNAPMDVSFSTGDTVERGSKNMNVNGSTNKVIFTAHPFQGTDWDICEIAVYIEDNVNMDGGTFGGLPELEKGFLIRKKNSIYDNMFEITKNGYLALFGTLNYNDRASGSGVYSLTSKLKLNDRSTYGITIRLLSEENDQLEFVIQDNLNNMYCSIHGHVILY